MNLRKLILTNNDCYKAGKKIAVKGIMVHSTGANNPWLKRYVGPDDGLLGVNKNGNHWNTARPGGIQVCVHAFIGKLADGSIATYQTLPWNHRGWHGGGSSNNTHIGFEICEDGLSDSTYFNAVYKEAVELCAYLCKEYGLTEQNIICHSEGYKKGIASNHGDVMHWFPKHGKSMDTFRADVKALLDGTSNKIDFPDVANHYAENHIKKLRDYGVVNGYEDGTFKPDKTVTRAEFSAMAVGALEKACGYSLQSVAAFSDIGGHWAETIIKKLVACGIVNGFEDGTFRPEQVITRGQAAMIACNVLLYCGVGMKSADSFPDTIGHYAEKHINTLKAYGVVNGFEDGLFYPEQEITRGQAAMYISNCLTVLGK